MGRQGSATASPMWGDDNAVSVSKAPTSFRTVTSLGVKTVAVMSEVRLGQRVTLAVGSALVGLE